MLIDAHFHMWERRMLPDEAVRNYMEPLKKFADMYGELFNFHLDDAIPFEDYGESIDIALDKINKNNVDYAVVLGIDFELVNEHRMSNEEYMDWLFQRCSVDDRFIPFISVDPNRGEDALAMIERLVKRYDPKGIKVYPATGYYPNDPKFDKYWDLIDDLGLLVTTHAGMALAPLDEKYCHPKYFDEVAEKHPDLKIIIAHLGGKFHDELYPLMDAHENIYTDCSALQGWFFEDPSMINKRLDSVTSRYPDRVVFGTDFPLYEEQFSLTQFLNMIWSAEWGNRKVKEDLLGNNMARLLHL